MVLTAVCALGYSHLELAIAALYTTSVQVSILLVCKTLLQISDAKTKPLGQSILAWGSHMCVCNINVPFCWFAEFYNFSCSYMYDIKITGTRIDLEIAVTRFIQPMPILTPPSTKSFLGSNPFRPAHIL